jgi:hypothetical protein
MGIERDLHELLYCHDCVIVPQWGGFLTHYRGARVDEGRYVVHPPGKDLSFNRNLERNDGLLANHLAKREGRPYAEAQGMVEDAVKQWRRTLEAQGRLEIPSIGIFYHDAERNLQFDPDRHTNYLKDAHGLRPVTAVPVAEAPGPVRVLPRSLPGHVSTEEKRATVIWAAAAVAALLFGSAAFWAYRMGGTPDGQWSSLDPFGTAVQRSHVPAPGAPDPLVAPASFDVPLDLHGIRELPLAATGRSIVVNLGASPHEAVAETTAVHVEKPVVTARARFHIIGGCFAQEENAERFMQELREKGYSADRLPRHNQLHPVTFGSYVRREDAVAALAQIKAASSYGAWLLVR